MKLISTVLLVFTLVLSCRSVDLNENDPELQKFFDSLNPVKKDEIKKDSKSILKEYLNEKKGLRNEQNLKAEELQKFKLEDRKKLPLTTTAKNVVGLMQQVEKLIKKSIKVSDKTVPTNIDFNAIDHKPSANVRPDHKKNGGLPKRSGGSYSGDVSGNGYNVAPSGGGNYNNATRSGGYNVAPTSSYPGLGYGSTYYQQQGNNPFGASYDNDSKKTILIEHKPMKFAPKEHPRKKHKIKYLDLHDYKSIWLQMIFNVHKLMDSKYYMKGDEMSSKILKLLFKVLKGISILPQEKKKHVCPYSYDTTGSLCLTAEYLQESLTYDEARQYCQLIKGGDLVIIRNACEFKVVVEYLEEIDPYRTKNYWIGANDVYHEGHWTNVDGSIFPLGPPFWGKVLDVLEPSGSDPVITGKEDYGMMMGADFFYIHDVSNNQGTALHGIPLCQYVYQRDKYQKNSEKPKGWGPYAAYNEWKKHKQNNIFDNYFGYGNQKPENPFEEYEHFNYKPPEDDFTSEEYQISPYVKPTDESNNYYESEGPSAGNYGKPPPEYEYKPVIIEGPYEGNDPYVSIEPYQSPYVKPPDEKPLGEEYNNYNGEKPYQVLPEAYPDKEPISYKPINEMYNIGYDQAHLENDYLENISNSYGTDYPSSISYKPIIEGYNNGYDQAHLENQYLENISNSYGTDYPSNQENDGNSGGYTVQQGSYGNPSGYPVQQGSYGNPSSYPAQQGSYGNPSGYPVQQGSYDNQGGYPVQQLSYGNPSSFPVQQGSYGNPSGYPVQQVSYGSSYPAQEVSYISHSNYIGPQESFINGGYNPSPQQYVNNDPTYGNSYKKENSPQGVNNENLKHWAEIHGNSTLNVSNPKKVSSSQIYNPQIHQPQNIPVLNLDEPNIKGHPPISHLQYPEVYVDSSLQIPNMNFSGQQTTGMLIKPVTSPVSSNPYSTFLITGQQSEPYVNNGVMPPTSHVYQHVGTTHNNNIPQTSQLNPFQLIQGDQNSQLTPVNQNSPYSNQITNFQYEKSPSSVSLINTNSYPGGLTQVNHNGSPQLLHNNYNQNDVYSQANHNPVTIFQQAPGAFPYNTSSISHLGNSLPVQGSTGHIFLIQGNSQHSPVHQNLQAQSSPGSILPEQYYLGNTQFNNNEPSLQEKMESNINGQPQNIPYNIGSTASLQQSPLQPQIYVISNSHLPNVNLPQLQLQHVYNSGVNSGRPPLPSPVQIVHASDLRSPAFPPELLTVNNQLSQATLPNAPNYQLLTLSNQPTSASEFHQSIYSPQNMETNLVNPNAPYKQFLPNHGFNVGKLYRNDELNFPERFSKAQDDQEMLPNDSSIPLDAI